MAGTKKAKGAGTETDAMKIKSFIDQAQLLGHLATTPDVRLRTAEAMIEEFETISTSKSYGTFVKNVLPIFLGYLKNGGVCFIREEVIQQGRKAILELVHRMLPNNDHMRPHIVDILGAMFQLIETDNEENVVICVRIIIDLHKEFKPPFTENISGFLSFVKRVYKELPGHVNKIFDPKRYDNVKDANIINLHLNAILDDIYTVTNIQLGKKNSDGPAERNIIPRGRQSLKVLQDLPIIVVLMYQLHRSKIHQEVAEFIPIVVRTIELQPSAQQRRSPHFNRDILTEFMVAQAKTVSFLAYVQKCYQKEMLEHGASLATGLISLLGLCPNEVSCLRRELFIAIRHFMATDVKYKFIPHLDKLYDDEISLGRGWTVNETMLPLAYSTFADLAHHVRHSLSLKELNSAMTYFSYRLHNERLPLSVQIMCSKAMFTLVESIRVRSDAEGGNGNEILLTMLDMLLHKLKVIVQVYIPYFLQNKDNMDSETGLKPAESGGQQGSTKELGAKELLIEETPKEQRRLGSPWHPVQNCSIGDCGHLLKSIFCAVKAITLLTAKEMVTSPETGSMSSPFYEQIPPKESEVYLKLVRLGLKAVRIFAINEPGVGGASEEESALECLAATLTQLNSYTFREVFTLTIDTLVEEMHNNVAVTRIVNTFLVKQTTSAVFTSILLEYLLEKMPQMGAGVEKGNTYLQLFKLVFGALNLFGGATDYTLQPHLRDILYRCLDLSRDAKEPCNYFLLMRALFRSLGNRSGGHEQLQKEVSGILPHLIKGLLNLLSGCQHQQNVKDLLVELCLSVPVHTESLSPYLSLIMNPVVLALNGPPTVVIHGLRILDQSLNTLHRELLEERMRPVRREVMHALWRILNAPNEPLAIVALQILGRFGGLNRSMIMEPQNLEFADKTVTGQCVTLQFKGHKSNIALPIDKILEAALESIRNPSVELSHKREAWEIIKTVIMSSLAVEDDLSITNKIILHGNTSQGAVAPTCLAKNPLMTDEKCRKTLILALTGIFTAVCLKEMKREAYMFMVPVIRHIALVIVSQQAGPYLGRMDNMDPYVLFDAMTLILAKEGRDMIRPVQVALSVLMNCVISTVHNKDRACSLPMVEYLTEKILRLCYDNSWNAKIGGCKVLGFLLENTSSSWSLSHQDKIVKAMHFVLTDLSGEVSAGILEIATENLEKLILNVATCSEECLEDLKKKCLQGMALEFLKHVISPITQVRHQSMKGLELLAELQSTTVSALVEPHRGILSDVVPPKKPLRHQTVASQLTVFEGNIFCLSLRPQLFQLDLSDAEHRKLVSEVVTVCDSDTEHLLRLPCYRNVRNFVPLKMSMMRFLTHVTRLNPESPDDCDNIVNIFIKGMASGDPEMMKCGYECLKSFKQKYTVCYETQRKAVGPILQAMKDDKTITIPILTQFSFYHELFPDFFTDEFWLQLYGNFEKLLAPAVTSYSKIPLKSGGPHELKLAVEVLSLFPSLPRNKSGLLEPLINVCLNTEKRLLLGEGSPLRPPLFQCILREPQNYLDFVFQKHLDSTEWNSLFVYFLQQDSANEIRKSIPKMGERLVACLNMEVPSVRTTRQFFALKVMNILSEFDENWITGPIYAKMVKILRTIWENNDYQMSLRGSSQFPVAGGDSASMSTPTGMQLYLLDSPHDKLPEASPPCWRTPVESWEEPQIIAMLLLSHFRKHPDEIEILFKLLLVYCGKSSSHCQFHFLDEFLEKTVAKYSVEWKRKAFFKFVRIFAEKQYPEELLARIIQYILIPCVTECFESGEGDELIGSKPMPDVNSPDNVVSVFLLNVLPSKDPGSFADCVRIQLSILARILVEKAPDHIIDPRCKNEERQNDKLRCIISFAWPCLPPRACLDPSTKYYAHLLLSHVISKFPINRRVILSVFRNLLKASALEVKNVVREALEILAPALLLRLEDGHTVLITWTKKILVEEGHSLSQLMHLYQLIIRLWPLYYPVRQVLLSYMRNAIHRLGFAETSTFEHRKLAVELAEVIIKWELKRIENEKSSPLKKIKIDPVEPNPLIVLPKSDAESIINCLLRLAVTVNELNPNHKSPKPGELLSKKCMSLLNIVLKPGVWLPCELDLAWLDKLFLTITSPGVNVANVSTGFAFITHIIGSCTKKKALGHVKSMQAGISACMTFPNSKVISDVNTFMAKLLSLFPTDFRTQINSTAMLKKYEELEHVYTSLGKFISQGLTDYTKVAISDPQTLFGPLSLLKSACESNMCYVDKLIIVFMEVIKRLTREHLNPISSEHGKKTTELLVLTLNLAKHRVGVMGKEIQNVFITQILAGLIEKSTEPRVVKEVVKMLGEWMKTTNPFILNQAPSFADKSLLLVKIMNHVETRFSGDNELQRMFLELVHFIYTDPHLKSGELQQKLEPAFLTGLRCTQIDIRAKFFKIFDTYLKKGLHERIMYIICSQNWEAMGSHFWIKQCAQLLLCTAINTHVEITPREALIPAVSQNSKTSADYFERVSFLQHRSDFENIELGYSEVACIQELESHVEKLEKIVSGVDEAAVVSRMEDAFLKEGWADPTYPVADTKAILIKEKNFAESVSDRRLNAFIHSVSLLIHADTKLADNIWRVFFPLAWKIFDARQQKSIELEIRPFLCSGSHLWQRNSYKSTLNTIVEAVAACDPPMTIQPWILYYVGKNHNVWHRMALLLEEMALGNVETSNENADGQFDQAWNLLSELYSLLREEDLWAGIWQRRAGYPETEIGTRYEAMGCFEKAKNSYYVAITKATANLSKPVATATSQEHTECALWEDHWMRCSKELNRWDIVREYVSSDIGSNPLAIVESAWRVPDWTLLTKGLAEFEPLGKDEAWKVRLYEGYLALSAIENQDYSKVERCAHEALLLCLKHWRGLPTPNPISNAHISVLQGAQTIMELEEGAHIRKAISQGQSMDFTLQKWRNRLPCIEDDLSHWSHVFTWREQHYQLIYNHFKEQSGGNNSQYPQAVHASAQGYCHFGKIARKQNQASVCLDSLLKIYSFPSIPVEDCFEKFKQQVKCYWGKTLVASEMEDAVKIVDSINLDNFTPVMISEFLALKGQLFSQIGRLEDSVRAHNESCNVSQSSLKAWGLWGACLETLFTQDPEQIQIGVAAVNSFIHSCCIQKEAKGRKYIANILWLLMYDDEKGSLINALSKAASTVPSIMWLPWIPQLLTSLSFHNGNMIMNLIVQVGRMYPQAVYYPLRSLFLGLKVEERDKSRRAELIAAATKPIDPIPKDKEAVPPVVPDPAGSLPPQMSNQISPDVGAASTSVSDVQLQLAEQVYQYQLQMNQYQLQLQQIPKQGLSSAEQLQQTQHIHTQIQRVLKQQQSIRNYQKLQKTQMQRKTPFPSSSPMQTPQPQQHQNSPQKESSTKIPVSIPKPAANVNSSQKEQDPAQSQQADTNDQDRPAFSKGFTRCYQVMSALRNGHPTIVSSLEGIVDQLACLRENWYEEMYKQLSIILEKSNVLSFKSNLKLAETTISLQLQNYVKKVVSLFGYGGSVSPSLPTGSMSPPTIQVCVPTQTENISMPSTLGCPSLQECLNGTTPEEIQNVKIQFSTDFDISAPGADKLDNLISKTRKWIKLLEAKARTSSKSFLLTSRFKYLQNFSSQIAEIEIPGDCLIPRSGYYVKIAKFLPQVEIVQKHKSFCRRIFIRGHDGKIYPYLILHSSGGPDLKSEERVMQFTRMLNHNLSRQKETAKRNLRFTVPKFVALSPQLKVIEDNPDSLSFLDIFKERISRAGESDCPIASYYEKVADMLNKGQVMDPQNLESIFRDIQENIVKKSMLKNWAQNTYASASDYWSFRKTFALQVSMWAFAEYTFHLVKASPELMYVHKDSGMIDSPYYKFDIEDGTGKLNTKGLVPFRLTPNIAEFLTPFGVQGPMVSTIVSIARCLAYPNYKIESLLKAIMRDEFISWIKNYERQGIDAGSGPDGYNAKEAKLLINFVNTSVNAIMQRMRTLATVESPACEVSKLIDTASDNHNLCRMNPAWYPWL